MTSVLRACVV